MWVMNLICKTDYEYVSNSLEWNFHWAMNLLIVFRDGLNIRIPSIFPSYLLQSLSTDLNRIAPSALNTSVGFVSEPLSECWISLIHSSLSWWVRYILPFCIWCSQEWNGVFLALTWNIFIVHFILVRNISVKNKWSSIKWCLESRLGRFHCWTIFWPVLYWHCLDSLTGNWFLWSILSEEFRICHCWVIERNMVVHWTIEVFSITSVSSIVILWAFYIKVWDPSELTIDITVFWNTRVIWHSGSLNFIHLIWIVFSSWL